MIKNHFLIAFRSMLKNRVFIIINVFGMGIAIACCIVGYFVNEFDKTFDANHKNREQIYRVTAVRDFENTLIQYGYAPMPLGEIVDKTFLDVNKSSRYFYSYSNVKIKDDLFSPNISYVDPEFFEIFSFDFISGKPTDLTDKTNIFLSEEMAVRLFGSAEKAYGKLLTQVIGSELREYKVAAVFREQPMNSSFYRRDGTSYIGFENCKDEHKGLRYDDWEKESTLFVKIDDPGRVRVVYDQFQSFTKNNNEVRENFQIKEFQLSRLTTMAHEDRAKETKTYTRNAPPVSAIVGTSVMSVLILLIACFNLTNTAIAISSKRLKEIGIRKVMGSMRKQLIFQFIGETTFICFLALLLGLFFADFLIEGWNLMWGYMRLTPHYFDNLNFFAFLVGVLLFTGILAGSYPAFYISKFQPVNILKGKVKFGGTNLFTRTLLGLQFAVSLMAIACAIGFIQNASYQKEYDLGFEANSGVIVWLDNSREVETFKNELQSNPEVRSIAGAGSGIYSNHIHQPVKHESKQVEVDIIEVGDNYLSTLDLKLVAGRDFMKDSETDQRESVIITQKMADLFGLGKPLGKELMWKDTIRLYVVGVVKDVYTMGLWRELEPMMIRYITPDKYDQLVVSANKGKVSLLDKSMRTNWNRIFPNRLYNGHIMSSRQDEVNTVNANIAYMFTFLGAIAMMLSATGLFTLVSLNIIKRMKEIGVRKVLGASAGNITRIVNTEFVIILLIASMLGSAMSYLTADLLMSSIWRYYQGINMLTFVISTGLIFIVSFLTIGYKVFSVAMMNPVNTLRDE